MPTAKGKFNNQEQSNALNAPQQKISAIIRNNQMHLMPPAKGKCNNQKQSNALNAPSKCSCTVRKQATENKR